MNEVFPRCAVPGSSCRLLQLEAPGARPVWAVLDAAGTRHFTGEITLHCQPMVRAWFNGGELYYAERDADPELAQRLLAMGVVTSDDLAAGSVQLGSITHLGRLFDRVPHLDRDHVELALEILTGEVVGEIADHVVEDITIASYRHHASGVVKWQRRPTVVITQAATDVDTAPALSTPSAVAPPLGSTAPTSIATPPGPAPDLIPTAEDEALVAEYEASRAETALALEAQDASDAHDSPLAPGIEAAAPVTPVAADDPFLRFAPTEPTGDTTAEQLVYDDLDVEAVLHHHEVDPDTISVLADATSAVTADATDSVADVTPDEPSPLQAHDAHETPEAPEAPETHETPETPAEASDEVSISVEDALASFERSFSERLDAQFSQQFGHLLDTPASTIDSAPPFALPETDLAPALSATPRSDLPEPPLPPLPPLPPAPAAHAVEPAPISIEAEQRWAIDDRVEWQVDATAPAFEIPVAASVADQPWTDDEHRSTTTMSAPSATGGNAGDDVAGAGPVVEFDLQRLLREGEAMTAAPSEVGSGASGVSDAAEGDDDIRAAVQAALAEIAAATRTGGDHEVPSILMQAALVADADTGLPPGTDTWGSASTTSASPATERPGTVAPPTAARPVLPARAPSGATAAGSDQPSTDGAAGSTSTDAGQAPAGPPSQEVPATGGLRRLMGSKKT